MDISSDIATSSKLRFKKMQDAAKNNASAVINIVKQQVALRRNVSPTQEQVDSQSAAIVAANQANYNNIRKGLISKLAEHRQKEQNRAQVVAQQMLQKEQIRREKHQQFIEKENQRAEQRLARSNVTSGNDPSSGIF